MLMQSRRELPEGCISDLEFDEWRANELDSASVNRLTRHLTDCGQCRARHADLEAQVEDFLQRFPELELAAGRRSPGAPPGGAKIASWKRGWAIASGLGGLAAAALAFLYLWPVPTGSDEIGTRIKGGVRLGFFVKRDAEVMPGYDGHIVHPGDQLRFTLSTLEPGHAAIFSLDGAGVASIYYPAAPRSRQLGTVRDWALDQSIELDASLGRERVWAVLCDAPFELEPVRAHLAAEGELPRLTGCTSDGLTLIKQAGP
jgi:hypothetical protein